MAIHINTRTIHTIHIDIPDDVIGRIESSNDEVEVQIMLHSRFGNSRTKKLSYRDIQILMGE